MIYRHIVIQVLQVFRGSSGHAINFSDTPRHLN